MAKIAVLLLLVALVAICNGHRLARDIPEAPKVPEALQPAIDNVKKLLSEENIEKLKKEFQPFEEATKKLGKELSDGLIDWFNTVVSEAEKRNKN